MTILKCTAVNCLYNKSQLCSRGEIDVIVEQARVADETSCGSFLDRREAPSVNRRDCGMDCGCETISIDCKAQNCTYNEHCRCTAASIDVSGDHASACRETRCDTFACKC
ncbi:MAG: DUF1540 domain-containing protein [Clostridiales bacterium]|nr:DUF1540 domain-containing protein [Clostridiales bacterium]